MPEHTQFVYDTELDCLLDIVTEPENQGLKVYKHQAVTTVEPYGEIVEFGAIQKLPRFEWDYEYNYYSKEEILKLPEGSYEFLIKDHPYTKSQPHIVYHWVEAFLQ